MGESVFGNFIRARRVAAGLSLRAVADRVGVTHVYLGEVERGVRPPLNKKHWPALIEIVPNLTEAELEMQSAQTKPVQLALGDAPPRYQELGLALARRIERRDLGNREMDELLRLLKGEDE
ncbi:transcriptional regulator [Corallococcus interemptor]|uniref:Transcriptional regulator n=1 Tax=Corallococcus interemptor TaxID=2316720 RepID=A0A3A8QKN5_9BACT|nr:helix-turn-helix domain-containing protein [Corallococcus interemptor]RKH69067.1 transcriptional regulator [Corallococcus interemptor]